MQQDKQSICPECDSLVNEGVCLNCGHIEEKGTDAKTDIDTPVEIYPQPGAAIVETSMFAQMASMIPGVEELPEKRSYFKLILPIVLVFLLMGISAASYYRFLYNIPEFISPLVLSAQDIKQIDLSFNKDDLNSVPLTSLGDENEKTVELDPELDEGNLKIRDYAKFANAEFSLIGVAFNLKNSLVRFANSGVIDYLLKEAEITDDDLAVYFSDSFAFILPENNMDTWGIVTGVEDKEYVQEKLKVIESVMISKDYANEEYPVLYFDVVELKDEYDGDINLESKELLTPEELAKIEGGSGEDSDADDDSSETSEDENEGEQIDESGGDGDDSEGTLEGSDEESEVENTNDGMVNGISTENISADYLLISNSKEFLDQMREASEGALPNLSVNIEYVRAKENVLTIANAFVYRNLTKDYWPQFSEWIGSKYEYVGLNKILSGLNSAGLVFYTKDGRLKILSTENK